MVSFSAFSRIIPSSLLGMIFSLLLLPAQAEPLAFDSNWKEQGFLRLWSNEYTLGGNRLDIESDGTVSLLYRSVPQNLWGADSASWRWSVSASVSATDLTLKGGDDRNIAMYFVFVDQESAERLSRQSARKLLQNENTRALVYVWGGAHPTGAVLESPYGPGILKTIILRGVGTGDFRENIDLNADFARAFGEQRGVLIGVGITADSDDTNGMISASVSDLSVF